jgi:hypothetical protein
LAVAVYFFEEGEDLPLHFQELDYVAYGSLADEGGACVDVVD